MKSSDTSLESFVLQGDFLQVGALFRELREPSAAEKRWFGLACLALGQRHEAVRLLEQAYREGVVYAAIHLAAAHRFGGDVGLATRWLNLCPASPMDPLERTLLLREWGMLSIAQGKIGQAIKHFESAWVESFSHERTFPLQSGIAQALGYAQMDRGNHRRALDYLERSTGGTFSVRAYYTHGAMAVCYAYLGDVAAARRSLEVARTLGRTLSGDHSAHDSLGGYQAGVVARAAGEQDRALEHFEGSIAAALEKGEEETEVYAQLGLIAVYLAQGNTTLARRTLARAEVLSLTPRLQAFVLWRQGCLALCLGEVGQGEAALSTLERAYKAFFETGYLREAGWAALWCVEAALAHGSCEQLALEALERVLDLQSALGEAGWVGMELPALKRLSDYLLHLGPEHAAYGLIPPAQLPGRNLTLKVLGQSCLLLYGQALSEPSSRVHELLWYLLRNPGQTLTSLVRDLLPEAEATLAHNHLESLRNELHRAKLGLSVEIDGLGRWTLRLEAGLLLRCDLLDLEEKLKLEPLQAAREYQPLFSGGEGEWIGRERERIEHRLLEAGLLGLNAAVVAGDEKRAREWSVALSQREILQGANPGALEFLRVAGTLIESNLASAVHGFRTQQVFAEQIYA